MQRIQFHRAQATFRMGNPIIPSFCLVHRLAQTVQPKIIDVHEHFNGEPGVLDQLLVKLNAADGIGILLVTPRGFSRGQQIYQQQPDTSSALETSSWTIECSQ